MNRKIVLALVALMAFSLMACTSLNQVTPAPLDNAAMEADVRAAIAEDHPGQTFSIGVSVDNGIVTLTGSVESAAQRSSIAAAANRVDGVRSVINNLTIG
jgi:osmotically-inducible protein OsmY